MRRAAAAATIAFALLAGTARGDTFSVVPSNGGGLALPALGALPGTFPNGPGSIRLPLRFTSPPAIPEQLSYPQLQALWQRAGAAYSVPWQVLGAINKVESNFGRNMGPSSAGAIGWMQFMPSTWLRWGTDANGDGIADPWNAADAVFSAARYLAASGGSSDIYRAVFAYNHADWYVQEVLGLAHVYGSGGAVAFTLDQLQLRLAAARRRVAEANRRLETQLAVVHRLAAAERPWLARAQRAPLLSDRLAAQQHAGRIELQRRAAAGDTARLERQLAAARQALVRVRAQAAPASFSAAVGPLLQAPSYVGGWVFPVGGGPNIVSAAHTHHDYPAVDIAAPAGSPVYAISDALVLRAWHYPDPRCGIGLTFETGDGQVWTYCHLAYEEPGIRAGVHLFAGESVGLVGSTGDATGPHLHLQLQPPTQWPQQESWFQAFAGRAFSWQDAPTPQDVAASGPVFRVEPGAAAQTLPAAEQTQVRQLSSVVPATGTTFEIVPTQAPVLFTH